MKTRECAYCLYMFDCEGRQEGIDYCLSFKARNDKAENDYREWRTEDARKKITILPGK